jgi:uncharacterized protein (DUF1810 family)
MQYNPDRFLQAQAGSYTTALTEVMRGRKTSHWMWYIFPQLQGLGHSDMARRYAIANLDEADQYLHHPILGSRLVEITEALLHIEGKTALEVFGSPDHLKLHSCMTLFSLLPDAPTVFRQVLDKYFDSSPDRQTIALLTSLK